MPPQLLFVIIAAAAVAVLVIVRVSRSRTQASQIEPDRVQLFEIQNSWQAPTELSTVAFPRPVAFSAQAKIALVFGLLCLVGFGVMSWFMYGSLSRGRDRFERLQRDGVNIQGLIVAKSERGSGKSHRYYLTYNYRIGEAIYQRTASVTPSVYKNVRGGQQVRVIYLPFDPAQSRLEIENTPPPLWVVVFPVGVFVLVALALMVPIMRQRGLLQYGQPAAAVVTKTAYVKGGRSVSYRFLDPANNEIRGQATVGMKNAPEPGAVVTILYDPNKTSRNVLYPPQMVKLKTN